MQFNFNEMQTMIQDGARRLLSETLSSDKNHEVEASGDGFSVALWEKMSALGWTGAALPEAVGGGNMGLLDLCILAEEIGRGAASLPLVASAGFSSYLLQNVEQTEFVIGLLAGMAKRASITVPALIDEGSRSERSKPKSKFRSKSKSKGGVISGAKIMVPFASSVQNILVTACGEDGELVIAVIDRDAEGVTIKRHKAIGGHPLYAVTFKDVEIRAEQIIAIGESAQTALIFGLEAATILSIAEVVGNCEGMLLLCAEYATVREQFGAKIGSFQAVSHPIADMRIQTDALRLLVYETAWLLDQGNDVALEVAGTKALANEEVVKMVHAAHAVHGAIGYTMEYDLQLYTRRARAFCLSYGDTHSETERAAVALGL